MDVDDVTTLFALLALLANLGAVALVVVWLCGERCRRARGWVGDSALGLGALVAGVATAGSLYLSEVAHFEPCELCWYQRICMYPLALVLTVAAVRRDWSVRLVALVLAGVGLALSVWHTLLQRVPELEGGISCDPTNPCTLTLVEKFSYLTIPSMAAGAFLLILLLLVVGAPRSQERT